MARLLLLALFCALEVALAQPYKFILALPLDAASGYRESHSAACTRVGLQATPSRVLLAGSSPVAAFWNLSTMSDIVSALGAPYALAAAPVAGCCSPSLWCSSGGGQCFTHAPLGADIAYENYGWLLGSPAVPVYACQALPMDAASLAARAAAAPFVASVGAAPTLYSTPSGLRLRLDGLACELFALELNAAVRALQWYKILFKATQAYHRAPVSRKRRRTINQLTVTRTLTNT
jgi:hypothetical protein